MTFELFISFPFREYGIGITEGQQTQRTATEITTIEKEQEVLTAEVPIM